MILDITGVSVVDSYVGNALISLWRATQLMGCQVVVSGIRPEVAQVIVGLGISFSNIVTYATLQTAIQAILAKKLS